MSYETEKPENQQDYNYRPKHIFDSDVGTKSRVFKYISAWRASKRALCTANLPTPREQPRDEVSRSKIAAA